MVEFEVLNGQRLATVVGWQADDTNWELTAEVNQTKIVVRVTQTNIINYYDTWREERTKKEQIA